ncbi:glutathione S-transferase family protein [Ramlibacter sp.]|uniref:glutathione S-transferase family protein n=1 Tax=Ramlibacter sp. TaxID=1917967 RepID=UPI003D114368
MPADLIFHHYANSPFSEKIRLIFGYKQLAWKSVIVPNILPKPDVLALTGGYRKTPVLQIGADVYCDTALICDVLEHLRPEPTLYPPHLKGVCRIFAQWADNTLFWAAMGYNFQPKGAAQVFAHAPPDAAKLFAEDRKSMMAQLVRLRPGDATSAYRSYLRRIANMVDEHDYLFGAQPCVADFAACHSIWFTQTQVPVMADILNATPSVGEWLQRMMSLGHGTMAQFDSAGAIAAAKAAEPQPPGANYLVDSAFQDDHGIPLGARVAVGGESFGPEPTEGTLIAATRTHYTLLREDDRTGAVHVHFPRLGYTLRKVEAG